MQSLFCDLYSHINIFIFVFKSLLLKLSVQTPASNSRVLNFKRILIGCDLCSILFSVTEKIAKCLF